MGGIGEGRGEAPRGERGKELGDKGEAPRGERGKYM